VRRVALLIAVLAGAAAWIATSAGADDSHTYWIELDNAFGIVEGSEVRIAGVTQGDVTDLDVNEHKRAVLTVEVSGPLSQFGEDTTCSSEPQSLIAEYFIDCQPKGPPLAEGGEIPVEQTTQTVQTDLAQNTFREPYKERLALIINEFGTGLAGNAENLNEAIRRGAPALRQFERVTDVLGDQNRIIRGLNGDSDRIMEMLAARRDDVVRFVQEARDTAAASADRREDLSRDFNLLDDFLAELDPTMVQLGRLAREQTPVLVDLRAAAPQLNRLALNLPAFGDASRVSLDSLGDASVVGRRALRKGRDEIKQLKRTGRRAPEVSEILADFVRDLDDPGRAVEYDARAADDTARKAPTGYTGLEGLLNYAYYQSGAINQFDMVGHLLHFSLFSVMEGACGNYYTGGKEGVAPSASGGTTNNILDADRCVSWLGPNQPRLAGADREFPLPPYDPAVCPDGSNAPELCDPAGASSAGRTARRTRGTPEPGGGGGGAGGGQAPPPSTAPPPDGGGAPGGGGGLPDLPKPPGGGDLPGLGGGGGGGLGDLGDLGDLGGGGGGGGGSGGGVGGLLDFLLGN